MVGRSSWVGMFLLLFLRVMVHFGGVSGESKGHAAIVDDSPQARTIFHRADNDSNSQLTHAELHSVFLEFDTDGDGHVSSHEFITKWQTDHVGTTQQGLRLFFNLDVDDDNTITEAVDVAYIFMFFDRDRNNVISEGEFVIQWVKISS